MAIYTINDFKKGDRVYHLSNPNQLMVAIEILMDVNEISCRWVDKNGKSSVQEFLPEELGKGDDLGPRVTSTPIMR